jgi:hypothetical protein
VTGDIERVEAGGFEDDLRKIIDAVETVREADLNRTIGRATRSEIIRSIKVEILRRFGEAHPAVKVKFLSGPYCDSNEGVGPARRMR